MGRCGPQKPWAQLKDERLRRLRVSFLGLLLACLVALLRAPPEAFGLPGQGSGRGAKDARVAQLLATAPEREAVAKEEPWEQLAKSASELFEDTSEFFEDTLKAAFQWREEEIAAVEQQNESHVSELLGDESVRELQEALSAQSESLSAFQEQASSLASPPSEFKDGLSAVFRSIKEVEEKAATMVGEVLQFTQGAEQVEVKAESTVPQGPYGLAVDNSPARRGADGGWVVPVKAWIYRRNEQRHRIRMALCRTIIMEMIHGIKDISEVGRRRYEERGRLIFRTLAFRGGERNVVLSVKFDGEDVWRELPPTNGLGRVEVDMPVPKEVAEASSADGTLGFTVRIPTEKIKATNPEGVTARASALLLEPDGVLVISDIDDTVKVTEVFLGKDVVVRNTFLEEFRPVSGMVNLYQSWAQEYGAAFAFVSHSPPELQEPLREFLVDSGFPPAPVYLRPLGGSKEERLSFKKRTISELLRHYPRRLVVLVGDSGERDPLICADLLRRHPVQVRKVLIRQVSPNSPVDEAVFADIPRDRWQVFTDPSAATLPDELRDLGSVPGILSYAASLGSKALQEATGRSVQGQAVVKDSEQIPAAS